MPKSDIFAKEKSRNKTHQTISRAIPHEKKTVQIVQTSEEAPKTDTKMEKARKS